MKQKSLIEIKKELKEGLVIGNRRILRIEGDFIFFEKKFLAESTIQSFLRWVKNYRGKK